MDLLALWTPLAVFARSTADLLAAEDTGRTVKLLGQPGDSLLRADCSLD